MVEYNIIKWALKRSKIFSNIPDELIKKFIQIAEIKECNNEEIICKRGENVKYLFGSIEGHINEFKEGTLANESMLIDATSLK